MNTARSTGQNEEGKLNRCDGRGSQLAGSLSRDGQSCIAVAEKVCSEIAPMWGLTNFVAVNPFWGFRSEHFLSAFHRIKEALGEDLLMPTEFYVERYRTSEFNDGDIETVLAHHESGLHGVSRAEAEREVTRLLSGDARQGIRDRCSHRGFSPATVLHELEGYVDCKLNRLVVGEISKFCGLMYGSSPLISDSLKAQGELFTRWLEFASCDRSLDLAIGLPVSKYFATNSHSVAGVFTQAYSRINLGLDGYRRWLRTELFTVKGWAAFLQHLDFERGKRGVSHYLVLQLLAIRLAYSLALLKLLSGRGVNTRAEVRSALSAARVSENIRQKQKQFSDEVAASSGSVVARYICQGALEVALVRRSQDELRRVAILHRESTELRERPTVQVILCIDVRSEPMRRALEAQPLSIETYGFAGFFGLTIAVTDSVLVSAPASKSMIKKVPQYPVLLDSNYTVSPAIVRPPKTLPWALSISKSFLKSIGKTPTSTFNYVESFGVGYGVRLVSRALGLIEKSAAKRERVEHYTSDMSVEDKVHFVRGFLKNTSLQSPLAPYVVLCGHKAETTNNPYHAGFDCGACGGHSGEINARVACEILNDAEVRERAREVGLSIPEDTRFIPAVHNTTTDELSFETHSLHDVPEIIRTSFENAGSIARRERAFRFADSEIVKVKERDDLLKSHQIAKSLDWSEIRPEWGLARNALFIAARREITKGINLDARAFLHEYDPAKDPDGSTLELILTAPGVVANWINLQYYASSVCPISFGAGDKIVHNLIGNIGVVLGNGGDLQCGLPLQCVHDGSKLVHHPLRLSMLVEAPPESIRAVARKSETLNKLLRNEWLFAYSLSPDGALVRVRPDSLAPEHTN